MTSANPPLGSQQKELGRQAGSHHSHPSPAPIPAPLSLILLGSPCPRPRTSEHRQPSPAAPAQKDARSRCAQKGSPS
ncbi:rCG41848 [Rattus norvegicus]|uniref:RCG41848 n=1 Tax=Rattus norvegicus TaxID=10116 RepID=A6KKP2_RAT|nr:rCG41848 [Rattus norvegicus]